MTDVNEQHLAAMGLSGVNLGEKYDQSLYSPDRCDQMLGFARCARKIGHDGVHARAGLAWPQDEVEPESDEVESEPDEVEPPTPDYVFRLIDALVTGEAPDFGEAPVPTDVEDYLKGVI